MNPNLFNLNFYFYDPEDDESEPLLIAQAESSVIPRIGEGVGFTTPEAMSRGLGAEEIGTLEVMDVWYTVSGDQEQSVLREIEIYVALPDEEDDDDI